MRHDIRHPLSGKYIPASDSAANTTMPNPQGQTADNGAAFYPSASPLPTDESSAIDAGVYVMPDNYFDDQATSDQPPGPEVGLADDTPAPETDGLDFTTRPPK